MAVTLAALNRRLLIDSSDPVLDQAALAFLADRGVYAKVHSIVVDDARDILFVHLRDSNSGVTPVQSHALGEALKAHARQSVNKTVDQVYWNFPSN